MKKLLKVCRDILKIPESDFEEAVRTARQRQEFISPLRMATTKRQHELGDYNMEVVTALGALRDLIRKGAELSR